MEILEPEEIPSAESLSNFSLVESIVNRLKELKEMGYSPADAASEASHELKEPRNIIENQKRKQRLGYKIDP